MDNGGVGGPPVRAVIEAAEWDPQMGLAWSGALGREGDAGAPQPGIELDHVCSGMRCCAWRVALCGPAGGVAAWWRLARAWPGRILWVQQRWITQRRVASI